MVKPTKDKENKRREKLTAEALIVSKGWALSNALFKEHGLAKVWQLFELEETPSGVAYNVTPTTQDTSTCKNKNIICGVWFWKTQSACEGTKENQKKKKKKNCQSTRGNPRASPNQYCKQPSTVKNEKKKKKLSTCDQKKTGKFFSIFYLYAVRRGRRCEVLCFSCF